jgi:hypothetical protein
MKLLAALFLLMLLASPLRAGIDSQAESGPDGAFQAFRLPDSIPTAPPAAIYGQGIASEWGGPGAASHDCRYPWTACQTRAVRSLDTGIVIIVTPQMYCDCWVGKVGPNGETERLIDLDPEMVAALGLDPAAGLWRVQVEPVDPSSGLPDGPTVPNTALGGTP